MGIRDFLRRRRERESALPREALAELEGAGDGDEPARPGADREPDSDEGPARSMELPGSDAAALGEILRRAASTGLPQVSFESHPVELEGERGAQLANEILTILGGATGTQGGGPQQLDPEQVGDLRETVRDALRRQGIDPDSGEPL